MRKCIVIGRPNAGKTLFVIRLAEFFGARELDLSLIDPSGGKKQLVVSIEQAIDDLSGPTPHQTLRLQSVQIDLPVGKGFKKFELIDTSGLIDGIHQDRSVRYAMAQTLAAVRDADLIFHVIDADKAGESGVARAIGDVDYQVAQFAQVRDAYLILANKMDLPKAAQGLERIRREFPAHVILPISALHVQGFKEVRRFVRQWI